MTEDKKYDIFLSYSRRDSFDANLLSKLLITKGFNVWIDQESIDVGDSFENLISQAISKSKFILVLISENYLKSKYNLYELKEIMKDAEHTDNIIFIKIDDLSYEALPNLIKGYKIIDYFKDKKSLDEVVSTLIKEKVSDNSDEKEHKSINKKENIVFEIKLNTSFDDFSKEQEEKLLNALKKLLETNEINIKQIKRGSTIYQFNFKPEYAARLFMAIQNGELKEFELDSVRTLVNKKTIFIGHGRSPLWRELKDFLSERLKLDWEEFNREPTAGYTIFERIENMLNDSCFAFLIMTAEDLHFDNEYHARENVIHEVGLFQGKLGRKKAIILLEDGCKEFSNVHGLIQLRFPKGNISVSFEEIRKILEREKVI